MKRKMPSVAVVYPASVPWMAECLRGIKHHADRLGGWKLVTSPPSLQSAGEEDVHLPALKTWRGDGVIACLMTREEEQIAAQLPMPVVNVSAWQPPGKGILRVNPDNRQIGKLAAEHLLALGLQHFAYYGIEGPWYSEERELGFVERLQKSGFPCTVFHQPANQKPSQTWLYRHAKVLEWLAALPKPVGVFAVHDYRARAVIELCEQLELSIPEDVAVLGVDNDTTTCDYCTPPLSSVSRDPFAYGIATAKVLDCLMRGQPVPEQETLVSPAGVVQRGSTDRFYDDDPTIRRVIDYAIAHAGEAFSVQDMSRDLKISRRLVELKFHSRLGITPLAYLQHRRVNHAKSLLLDHSRFLSLGEVATKSGFASLRTFRETFRHEIGYTPAVFRKRFGELVSASLVKKATRFEKKVAMSNK